MQNIDRDTIIKASNGDMNAFEEIYKITSGYVYAIAYRVLGNREDAEEAAQNAFVKAYKNLHKFAFKSTLKTWLYRITTNEAINLYKKVMRKKRKNIEYDDKLVPGKIENDIDDKIDVEENEKIIEKMLKILPTDQKLCLILKDIDGLSYEEISEVLGVKLNTVRTRLKRARGKLISRFRTRRDLL